MLGSDQRRAKLDWEEGMWSRWGGVCEGDLKGFPPGWGIAAGASEGRTKHCSVTVQSLGASAIEWLRQREWLAGRVWRPSAECLKQQKEGGSGICPSRGGNRASVEVVRCETCGGPRQGQRTRPQPP